jgi:actin-related protein
MFEICHESLSFEALQVSPQALLVLYTQCLVTGLVVDSGTA